jgi:hypothetical protein
VEEKSMAKKARFAKDREGFGAVIKRVSRNTWGVLLAGAMLLTGGILPAAASMAAEGDPQYLAVDKTVSASNLQPGSTFTYDIKITCSEENCVNANLLDSLPAEFDGFAVRDVQITPTDAKATQVWTVNGAEQATAPAKAIADTKLSVAFHKAFNGQEGLTQGTTAHVNLTLQVPSDLNPDSAINGKALTNTAVVDADNSAPAESSVDVTVTIPEKITAAVTKKWSPASAQYEPGAASSISMNATNTSNVTVDKMTVVDPQKDDAGSTPDGVTTLADDNPFRYVDFTGFGAVTLPEGAKDVQVDAYVFQNGKWAWVNGTPDSSYGLPGGVSAENVGGLRYTYTGSIPPKAHDSVILDVTQRESDRNGSDNDFSKGYTATNNVQAQTTKENKPSTPAYAHANYQTTSEPIGNTVSKNIERETVAAGESSAASITATNTGSAVNQLTVVDKPDFFDGATYLFNGFSEGIAFPQGAETASVKYIIKGSANPNPDKTVDFNNGETPALPTLEKGEYISSFEITFKSGTTNAIRTNATTKVKFEIGTSEQGLSGDDTQKTNTAQSCITAANGNTSRPCPESSDSLQVVKPRIDVGLTKSITPSANRRAGESVQATLNPTFTSATANVKPKTLIVTDEWNKDSETDFWNAFNLTTIEPTQVIAGSTLHIRVKTDGGYVDIGSKTAVDGTTTYGLNADELKAALEAKGLGSAEDITGIQFEYDSPDEFAASVETKPILTFTARETTRTGNPTDTVDKDAEGNASAQQKETRYKNTAKACGTSTSESLEEKCAPADADTGIIVYPKGPGTGPTITKKWDKTTLYSQSGNTASTQLNWTTDWGRSKVVISDPAADEGNTVKTAYDAFNLTGIRGLSAASVSPNLKYDKITAVELYSDGGWKMVSAPNGSWQGANGDFKGYQLSAEEQQKVTGIRITLEENTEAREAAKDTDPNAPRVGEGVQSSENPRTFTLDWQLRDTLRSDPSKYVSQEQIFNLKDENGKLEKGVIDNCASISTTPDANARDCDAINVYDYPPYVDVTKKAEVTSSLNNSSDTGNILVPNTGVVTGGAYPKLRYTLTAKQLSFTPATHVRVTDPAVCAETDALKVSADKTYTKENSCATEQDQDGAEGNPFKGYTAFNSDNPFTRQNITKITIGTANGVDLDSSIVWLLHYSEDSKEFSSTKVFATEANALDAADLADVVGVSVTFRAKDLKGGTIPNGTSLPVVLDTQVRTTLRDTGKAFVPTNPESSNNTVFTQSYNTTFPGKPDSTPPYDFDHAEITYNSGIIDVAPTKDISNDDAIEENAVDKSKTVTLRANQGNSTISPTKVTMSDIPDGSDTEKESKDFWTNFDMTSNPKITFPAGAEQVTVSARIQGKWVEGEPQAKSSDGAEYNLPDGVAPEDVEGLTFVFDKADGSSFADWNVPGWSAEVTFGAKIRDTQRGTDDPVVYEGNQEATDTLSAKSEGMLDKSALKYARDKVTWKQGKAALAIDKCAQRASDTECGRLADAGTLVPWDITIKNTGTGYLDITSVTDTPDSKLQYIGDGSGPEEHPGFKFIPQDGGESLLTEEPTLDSTDPSKLIFTWADGKNRMAPGETVRLKVWLELKPGITTGEEAVNTVSVTAKQKLSSVSDALDKNNGAHSAVTPVGENGATTADFVQPRGGENLYVVKGVTGSLPGAVNPTSPTSDCSNTTYVGADGKTYFRTPCAANSAINGTDNWSLHAVNAGTSEYASMTFFDQLPAVGDKMLVKGDDRSSQYRPQLTGLPTVVGDPEGSTVKYEISTDKNVCVGTWESSPEEGYVPCGGGWTTVDSSSSSSIDWSSVRGIRVTVDFTTSQVGSLKPGGMVDVTYSSVNVPKSSSVADGASVEAEDSDQLAWNQYGLLYTRLTRAADNTVSIDKKPRTIAPNKVGVHLAKGSMKVVKAVDGDEGADEYAPDTITATATCTIPDASGKPVSITFGREAQKKIELVRQSDGSYASVTVSGIPYGATCTVTEDGEVGEFGETEREGSPATVEIDNIDTTDGDGKLVAVPTEKSTATFTNTYKWGKLTVKKKVDTKADKGSFGPFTFKLVCTTSAQKPVDLGLTADEFTLENGKKKTFDKIPMNSTCDLEETDSASADSIDIEGQGVTGQSGSKATITVDASSDATVTNHYDAGTVTIKKVVDGAGAQQYGQKDFDFSVKCIYGSGDSQQELFNDTVTVHAGATVQVPGTYPAGTECVVAETDTEGATTSHMDPEDGKVTVAASESGNSQDLSAVTVTATNTFEAGYFKLTKKTEGTMAEKYGQGPFTFESVCVLPQANGGQSFTKEYSLSPNESVQSDLYPTGTECTITETDAKGATKTELDPADGVVTIQPEDSAKPSEPSLVEVTATNTFSPANLEVTKNVDTVANHGTFGPFSFDLSCTTSDGQKVLFDGQEHMQFVLEDGETWKAAENTIPANSTCNLVETDADGANYTAFLGENVSQNDDGSSTIHLGAPGEDSEGNETVKVEAATVKNHYDAGTLTIAKAIDGDGAEQYGNAGDFKFLVECSFQDELIDQETVFVKAGGTVTLGVFPSGTQCTVKETGDGGATTTTLDPEDGVVTVPPQEVAEEGEQEYPSNVMVHAVNTFDVTDLQIIKKRIGPGAAKLGNGPFEALVVCSYDRDGTETSIPLPNGGKVVLSDSNGYKASISGLLIGATCSVKETEMGGAANSFTDPADGKVTIEGDAENEVTITNYFNPVPPDELAKTGSPVTWSVMGASVLLFAGFAARLQADKLRKKARAGRAHHSRK